MFDLGGGGADASQLGGSCGEDVAPRDLPDYPLRSVSQAIIMPLHQEDVHVIAGNTRMSHSDQQLLEFGASYTDLLAQNSSMAPGAFQGHALKLGRSHADVIVLQRMIIDLAKQQQPPDVDAKTNADASQRGPDVHGVVGNNAQLQEAQAVPVPDAVRGPARVACQLLTENTCTGDQKAALALLSLRLQRNIGKRPDKTTHIRPTCEASGNQRAVWLGGGGVGKRAHLLRWCTPFSRNLRRPRRVQRQRPEQSRRAEPGR